MPPEHVQRAQGETDVPHAVCKLQVSEHPYDSACVEVGPVVCLLRSGAGAAVLPAEALFLVWASASPLAGFGVSPFPGGLRGSGRRLFRMRRPSIITGLVARARRASDPEVGVRDLFLGGCSLARSKGCF